MIKKSSLPTIFLLGFLMRTRFLPTVVLRGRVKYFAMAKIKTMENCLDACAVETAKQCIYCEKYSRNILLHFYQSFLCKNDCPCVIS